MQAALNRLPDRKGVRQTENSRVTPHVVTADDVALLEALPIAAAIFTLNGDKLWVEAMNPRFLELAGCMGDAGSFEATFKRYAQGPGGAFAQAFLTDPANAANELELADGEVVGLGHR